MGSVDHPPDLHAIARGLADEQGIAIGLAEGVVQEQFGAARTGEGSQGEVVAERRGLVAAVDAGVDAGRMDAGVGRDPFVDPVEPAEGRVHVRVVLGDQIDEQGVGVRRGVPAVPFVAGRAPLAVRRNGASLHGSILVPVFPRMLRAVQPVVHAEPEPVAGVLRVVESGEAVIQDDLFVGPIVAIGVPGQDEMRGGDQQDAIGQRVHGAGHHESVEKDGSPIHLAVAVVVVEHHDASVGLAFAAPVQVGHVAGHLDDPQPAIRSQIHGHGGDHQGLGGDQFDPESLVGAEGGQGIGRRQGGCRGDREVGGEWRLILTRSIALLSQCRRAGQQGCDGDLRTDAEHWQILPETGRDSGSS